MREVFISKNDEMPTTLPNGKTWIAVEMANPNFTQYLTDLTQLGFCVPYVCKKTPSGRKIGLSISLTNTDRLDLNEESKLNHILYTIKQFSRNKGCEINIRISPSTVDFLQNLPKEHRKEHSGSLYIKSIDKVGEDFVQTLEFEDDSIKRGDTDSVNVSDTRFNFHSHPEAAYVVHHVKKGWPSKSDYSGFLSLSHTTIFHCVTTLEGIYVISLNQNREKRNENEKFISQHYDIHKEQDLSFDDYVNLINSIEGGIFKLEFAPWEAVKAKVFKVSYSKSGLNCLIDERMM